MNKKRNRRELEFDQSVCAFCGESPDEKKCGKFFTSKCGFSVHQYCMFFSAGLPQNGKDDEGFEGFLEQDVLREIRRAGRLRCCMCGKKGASAGCCDLHCKKGFHFVCGVDKKYLFQFFGQFRAYCVEHRPQQNTPSFPTKKSQCPICLESIRCHVSPDILTTPCCKDIWFHRSCVQEQAVVSGYFFRCSVCNDKGKFVREMKRMGIYVPDRDAAWEDGDNFAELLEKYSRCDNVLCDCPLGRKHSADSGKWEMVLCASCGQFGTHVGCKNWNTNPPYLLCPTCRPAHEGSIPTTDAAASSLTSSPGGTVAKSSNNGNGKGGRRPRKKRQHVDSDTDSDDMTSVLNGLKRQTQDDFLSSDTSFSVQRAIAAGAAAMSAGGLNKFKTSQCPVRMPFDRKRKAQDDESDDEIRITKYVPGRQKCEICPNCRRRKPPTNTSEAPTKSSVLPRKLFRPTGASSTVGKKSGSTCTKTTAEMENNEADEGVMKRGKLDMGHGTRYAEARNVKVADYEVLELAAEHTDKSSVLLLPSEEKPKVVNGTLQSNIGTIQSFWRSSVERLFGSWSTHSSRKTSEKSSNETDNGTRQFESANFISPKVNKEASNVTRRSSISKGREKAEADVDVTSWSGSSGEESASSGGKSETPRQQSEMFEKTSETTGKRKSWVEKTSGNIAVRRSALPGREPETDGECSKSFVNTSESNSRQMLDRNSNASKFSSPSSTSRDGKSRSRSGESKKKKKDFQFLSKKAVLEAVIDHAMELKKSGKELQQRCVSSC